MTVTFSVLPGPDDVAHAAATAFVEASRAAVAARGRFYAAIPGGRTPLPAFVLLTGPAFHDRVPWERVELFWADERAVGPDDPQSNYRAAREVLLDHAPSLSTGQVHRMMAEAVDLETGARAYEAELRRVVPAGPDGIPVLDLVWLGVGADGHTASLCPNDPSLAVTDRLVVPTWPAGYDTARLTLTYPVLNAAREIVFAVNGADKAETLAAIRAGADLPAARVRAAQTRWLVDAAAAGQVADPV
ncbi:MAG TPA: 6-phosphogluconolactonase [Candidatus Limnocylindria bacterium]|nr:6-phosphogluconolactonase [Candidatus Limnocylindria bacterium]